MNYADLISADVPQTEPLDARQVKNNAGGYVYGVDDWTRLDRFLILGSDQPTYYQSARKLTRENADCVEDCYALDRDRTVARIVEISEAGRAPRNDSAIFALALGAVAANVDTRRRSLAALSKVCRTGTHLFQFIELMHALKRGWGRTLKRAVADWYEEKELGQVAYQAIKYRSREGWTHKRALQVAHPGDGSTPADRVQLYRWICGKEHAGLPPIVTAHMAAMQAEKAADLLPIIQEHKLPWEALPTWALTDPAIWQAMVPTLGLHAIVRNVGNMSRIGALAPLSETEAAVARRLGDEAQIRKSRLHPFAILQAMAVYGSGKGLRGAGSWDPSRAVLDALDGAFYKAFANVEPTGKRWLIALDISSSMGSPFQGSALTCRDATAALALVTMATEPQTHVVGFSHSLIPLSISPRQGLGRAVRAISGLPFGSTDCSLPMLYALQRKIPVDAFGVVTDNETYAGSVHPAKALRDYRTAMGIPAKLIVVGMTSTGFSIADPNDGGMLDVVGMDASVPALIADFARQ